MSLTINQCIQVQEVLKELIKNDKENKYVFASATRIKFALMLRKVTDAVQEFQKENDVLIKKYGKAFKHRETGEEQFMVDKGAENYKDFLAEQKPLLSADSAIDLKPIDALELEGKTNQLPIELLAMMFDTGVIVERFPAKEAKAAMAAELADKNN